MITKSFTYVAFLIFFASMLVLVEKKSKSKFFNYVPAIVLLYFTAMLLSTFGVWQNNKEITAVYKGLKNNLLPAMIFLMLLRCDMRKILKLGPKMLIGFFSASVSIAIGFIITYAIFKGFYEADTWKAFAALCGSWMGGTGNMVAVQTALKVPDAKLGYTLLMDSINYSIWVMFLLWLVSFSAKFNKWTKTDTKLIDEIGEKLSKDKENIRKEIQFSDLMILLGTSLLVSAISTYLGGKLPQTQFFQGSTWTVLIATLLGIIFAMTSLAKVPGASELSNIMLYTIVALIASRANFAELTKAPIYIISGFVILGIHAIVLMISAKLFKLDLFTCGVASLANIGGVASAPILAAAYSEALVPIGVLMALMGYIVGTGGGLLVGKILSII
ncbi:putative membrane protein [Clostridium tetanomorphum]|uniref:DUF819 domain-containing protein n=1 Tax=Clostridium tetanomorphum TaxID=1553 RepID=A0A923E9Q6_CLOTT|nr:DUF819 family protein [Clostridium tetanomorphum]KAJ50613.1 hypothetical protein CTM_16752 [Clostridium tetanomorphum DSM 665]MBC2399073.1 DUF819 domain-containing protein [Clostridium tetanomorphum]MBP1862688.1 putative membrane protein [Clostridium tetanomorphum]NRS85472.1 putative membrane protein [Clostridium tetanomorphum]NRZ98586.1 putative membrane protein [Clostridium tetanomorphum]